MPRRRTAAPGQLRAARGPGRSETAAAHPTARKRVARCCRRAAWRTCRLRHGGSLQPPAVGAVRLRQEVWRARGARPGARGGAAAGLSPKQAREPAQEALRKQECLRAFFKSARTQWDLASRCTALSGTESRTRRGSGWRCRGAARGAVATSARLLKGLQESAVRYPPRAAARTTQHGQECQARCTKHRCITFCPLLSLAQFSRWRTMQSGRPGCSWLLP